MSKRKTVLQRARDYMGFSSRRVAEALGIDVSGYLRIESGENLPQRQTARKIHRFYGGVIPLGAIYDPAHTDFKKWLDEDAQLKLEIRAEQLIKRHPTLTVRILSR